MLFIWTKTRSANFGDNPLGQATYWHLSVVYRIHSQWVLRIFGHASILPSIGQENSVAQPKTDKWFSFSSHFSSFFTVQLLFNCRFVAWSRGLPRKFADCVFVLINSVLLSLLYGWILMTSVSTWCGENICECVIRLGVTLLGWRGIKKPKN